MSKLPDLHGRRYVVGMPLDHARRMVRTGLADPTDRPGFVDVTDRVIAGSWVSIGERMRVLNDRGIERPKIKGVRAEIGYGWWVDGTITTQQGRFEMWIEGVAYRVYPQAVEQAA